MSPAPVKRAAPAPPVETVNFGSLNFYSGGFILPEGDYALTFEVMMEREREGSKSKRRLGVMIYAYPLANPEAEPLEQFMSMGGKAADSFAPDPNTGKGVVPIPGGVGGSLNNKTNWFMFLKSLYDCGLPEGIFLNDFTTIDGVWVHTSNVPEPEDRKSFGSSQTGENADDRKPGMVPVVSEIKEDGKPWEGSGGIGVAPKPAAAAPKAGPKSVAKAAKAAPAPVVEEDATDEEAVLLAATNGVSSVLENPKYANGVTKLLLRTQTFSAVGTAAGPDMAQAVLSTFFGDDAALNTVLGPLGYTVSGASVKPQA